MQDPAKEKREYYNKIGRIWSVELDDYVSFNNVGFQHLIRKGKAPRSPRQQIKATSISSASSKKINKKDLANEISFGMPVATMHRQGASAPAGMVT